MCAVNLALHMPIQHLLNLINRLNNYSTEFIQILLRSQNYRDFLEQFFNKELFLELDTKKQLTYAEFSRRAGFSSRAFIRDIINGAKSVNLNNFERICTGLKLNSDMKEYFKALVAIEESQFTFGQKEEPKIRLAKKKEKILKYLTVKKMSKADHSREITKLLLNSEIPLVYAASGTTELGASFDEIKKRSKLSDYVIENCIKLLMQSNILVLKNNRYYPCSPHIAIEELGGDNFFKLDFSRSLAKLKNISENRPQHNISLFLSSTFSVQESQLTQLKENLNSVLMEFITQSENPSGETLVTLTVGLVPT